uniref:Nuclear pore complex protein n=1 Tax=Hydra vulgaris TaxID=6087 RepID=T2MEI4_HYDVU
MEFSQQASPKILFSPHTANENINDLFASIAEKKNLLIEKDLRKQLGLKKSLQLLEQSVSPCYKPASSLLREAGTPGPFLPSEKRQSYDLEDTSPLQLYRSLLDDENDSLKQNSSILQNSLSENINKTNFESSNSIFMKKEAETEVGLDVFNEFMQHFVSHPHSADVFQLIEQYEQVCRSQIKFLQAHIYKTDPTRKRSAKYLKLLQQLYQECNTWRLIGSLLRDRMLAEVLDTDMSDQVYPLDSTRSEKIIVDRLFEREATTRQSQIIVDWLEKNMQDKLEDLLATEKLCYHSNSIYWEHTVHDLNQIKMGSKDLSLSSNLITEIDPDAPIRQQRTLSSLDQQDEEQLLQYMFKFIRAGKLEEAQKLCCDQGHYWRAASLDGWRLWHDPNFFYNEEDEIQPAEGNPNRDLWKINCWAMSEEKSFNIYEKAIYAALSGNLNQLLPACLSWEDCLWAYFKVLVDIRVEEEIRNNPRSSNSMMDLPQAYWVQTQRNDLTPTGIIDHIRSHPNIDIRKQAGDPYRILQTNIILNDINDFLKEMKKLIESKDPHLIRFLAHLVLFLQAIGMQTQDDICNEILHSYVKVLIDIKQNNLVATYTARLPPDMQVKVYANFLQDIDDLESRQSYLNLADEAGLDLGLITKCIVENIRAKDFECSVDEKSSKVDLQKITSIDWLIFDPAQRAEALKQANAIIRGFLAEKKHDSSQQLFDRIPTDSIDVVYKQWRKKAGEKPLPIEDDNAVREYLCIKAYLNAHDSFNAWFQHYHHQAPLEPEQKNWRSFKEQVAFEEELKEYKVQHARWLKTLESHVKSVSECIYNVLLFPSGWMLDERHIGNNDPRNQQMILLRQLCIPYLSFLLMSVLQSSQKHRECFQLAEIIQSRQHKLYEVFQKVELQKFLKLLRDSSIVLLQEGFDPLGFPRSNNLI